MSEEFPTPLEIRALAEECGYLERRGETSSTLFFREAAADDHPEHPDRRPVNVNVFYATRGIMTQIPHPASGYNELWRAGAYGSLEDLAMLFGNPRSHTGGGYRRAKNAVRGCAACGMEKRRGEGYTTSQWRAGPGKAICVDCCCARRGGVRGEEGEGGNGGGVEAREEGGRSGGGVDVKREGGTSAVTGGEKGGRIVKGKAKDGAARVRGRKKNGGTGENNRDVNVKDEHFRGGSPPALSAEALRAHTDRHSSSGHHYSAKVKNEMERRQYNCPHCPEEGRGKFVFFKRVPSAKPIVKCPQCKRVKRGSCERLYPIPRGEEKGYGHFRCGACASTWGSSRAIGNVGQQCQACALAGNDGQYVQPFRVEVYRSGGRGGGPRRARRVPREAIPEDDVAPASNAYSAYDGLRHKSGGRNALAAGGGDGFDWVDVKVEEGERPTRPDGAPSSVNKFAMMRHKCTGCASGICRRRNLPISGVHDLHDGDTASTSGSIFTNSVIDKSEFVDRDIDFDDWEDDDASEVWETVGRDGKKLRG